MRGDHGYMEEEITGKAYDAALLKRLIPFARPYRLPITLSVLMVVLIALLNLALPYVTKIAIDRYIVPEAETVSTETGSGDTSGDSASRYFRVDPDLPETPAIVQRHPDLFHVREDGTVISYEDLGRLPREDLKLLRRRDLGGVGVVALSFLILIVLDFGFNFLQKVLMEYTGHMLMHDLRVTLYRHVQGLSISFFSKNPVGRLVTRVTNDIQNMHELFTTVVSFIFNDICMMAGITVVLVSINLELTVAGFLVLPLVWWVAARFAQKARNIFRILRIKIAEINTRFSETIGGMKVIQMFLHESENYARFRKLNHENYQSGMDQIRLTAVFIPLVDVLGTTAIACVVFYGGGRVVSGHISLGELVAFISYIRMFFRPIRDVAEKYNIVQNALASAERIFLILDSKEKLPLPAGASAAPVCSDASAAPFSGLAFENVSFAYAPGEPVLRNISFHLAAGRSLGIVGPTGSGKSTMINLITRFYDPASGRVTLNGRDLKTLPPETYRCRMALVMQDPFLFSGTIRENILGGAALSDEALDRILAASNCRDMVARTENGLDTLLSEAGGSISSGERQLISIARAFARDPELIVMDEATSHIDSQTEQKIQDALFNLMKNRTAVVVAHRLATVRHLDHILVIRKGRIIESGTHETLMAQQGFYYGLHRTGGKFHNTGNFPLAKT